MPFNTLTVGAAVTPSVIETYISHYLHRAPLRQKPTAHISYHEGLRLIREFLEYSSKHTVEDLQNFTAQYVPTPTWVRINDAEIAPKFLDRAAKLLHAQLGYRGLQTIGGKTWWQWRGEGGELRAEWIEMKKEYHQRKLTGQKCERAMLYVHGGAYYFGSVDEHRYQMQRHARKLRARVLSPRYRLAPQFPFPCGLYDCLATYFYLLEHFAPQQILFAGDSAGAGMVLAMLVILRDQGVVLPAGTILLSPWVDLTHSFPSVAGSGEGDYIPSHGFHHKPSMVWPPPSSSTTAEGERQGMVGGGETHEGAVELPATADLDTDQQQRKRDGEDDTSKKQNPSPAPAHSVPRFGEPLSIFLNGKQTPLPDQIHLYTHNPLLSHPLVSPVLQPSLGGLPPMLIQTGGAELLRDEQLYLAHKAANPSAYPPNETIMREFDPQRKALEKWPPTDVQVQLWEDLCHVPQTLSFTRPAKYMYRSVAQFGAWALARSQERAIVIPDDDAISIISSGAEDGEGEGDERSVTESSANSQMSITRKQSREKLKSLASSNAVGKAGDPLPPFKDHMIRQRVTRHGVIYPLAPVSELNCLALDPSTIGVPKPGPVRKWLTARQAHDVRFANERKKIEKKRAKEASQGAYDVIPGENPPPTALVRRKRKGGAAVVGEEKKKKAGRSWGLAMWSGWGSSHDEQTLQRERKASVGSPSAPPDRRRDVSGAGSRLGVPNGGSGEKKSRESSVDAQWRMPLAVSSASAAPERQGTASSAAATTTYTRRDEVAVVDAGQADERSEESTIRPETAFSTASNQNSTIRPISASVNSPIPIENEVRHRRQESKNAREAPIALPPTVPTISSISEKIPGTENSQTNFAESRWHNDLHGNAFRSAAMAASNQSAPTADSQKLPAQGTSGTNVQHSELMGDTPAPVELPSVTEREDEDPDGDEDGARSSESVPETTNATALEPPTQDDRDELVSPITPTEGVDGIDGAIISPIEQPTSQKWPFKLRSQVFDQRTSMLGTIGADGMPNAHYAFLRDDSPRRNTPSRGTTPEPENKPPFKLRHSFYEPENIPEVKPSEPLQVSDPETAEDAPPAPHRESGALGMQLRGQRIVGDQMDRPPSYENGPRTNIIMPESVAKIQVVKPDSAEDDEAEEKPPPPPPKDEKHIKPKGKVTGLRKPIQTIDSVGSVTSKGLASKSSGSAAPVIGDLTFERPQVETFFTASDGRDVQRT